MLLSHQGSGSSRFQRMPRSEGSRGMSSRQLKGHSGGHRQVKYGFIQQLSHTVHFYLGCLLWLQPLFAAPAAPTLTAAPPGALAGFWLPAVRLPSLPRESAASLSPSGRMPYVVLEGSYTFCRQQWLLVKCELRQTGYITSRAVHLHSKLTESHWLGCLPWPILDRSTSIYLRATEVTKVKKKKIAWTKKTKLQRLIQAVDHEFVTFARSHGKKHFFA